MNYVISTSKTNVVLACIHRWQLLVRSSAMQHGSELGRKWDRKMKKIRRERSREYETEKGKQIRNKSFTLNNNRPCSSFISGVDVWEVLHCNMQQLPQLSLFNSAAPSDTALLSIITYYNPLSIGSVTEIY
jgi:hypothetical protein